MIGLRERGPGEYDHVEIIGEVGSTHHLVKNEHGLRVIPNELLELFDWSAPEIREEAP